MGRDDGIKRLGDDAAVFFVISPIQSTGLRQEFFFVGGAILVEVVIRVRIATIKIKEFSPNTTLQPFRRISRAVLPVIRLMKFAK